MVLESNFTTKGGGGAESQLKTLALALRHMGHRVTIVTPMLPSGPQTTTERCAGIPIARVPYPHRKGIGAAILHLRFAAFLLQRRKRYEVWHVHIAHHFAAITCLLGDLLGKPVVLKVSGWWELEKGLLAPGRGLLGRLAGLCLRRATFVQAISTRIAGELERHGFAQERIVVLPNAVDTARFQPRTPAAKPFVAVYVGRLVAEKDLGTLFDAWAQAFGQRKDVSLRLVGGGALESELCAQATRLGIQVEFLGHRDDVEAVLAAAHVGVLPSRIEGLSNTLLEFMACGLPTVASRVSGSEDFVMTGRNGWLFPPGDATALAACLREAESLDPSALAALGHQARDDVEAKASIPLVIGRLLQLYRERA
jgi:glycosyltransferase involved in cell wall biosynthesis